MHLVQLITFLVVFAARIAVLLLGFLDGFLRLSDPFIVLNARLCTLDRLAQCLKYLCKGDKSFVQIRLFGFSRQDSRRHDRFLRHCDRLRCGFTNQIMQFLFGNTVTGDVAVCEDFALLEQLFKFLNQIQITGKDCFRHSRLIPDIGIQSRQTLALYIIHDIGNKLFLLANFVTAGLRIALLLDFLCRPFTARAGLAKKLIQSVVRHIQKRGNAFVRLLRRFRYSRYTRIVQKPLAEYCLKDIAFLFRVA